MKAGYHPAARCLSHCSPKAARHLSPVVALSPLVALATQPGGTALPGSAVPLSVPLSAPEHSSRPPPPPTVSAPQVSKDWRDDKDALDKYGYFNPMMI